VVNATGGQVKVAWDDNQAIREQLHDYVFVSVGLEKQPIAKTLPDTFNTKVIKDINRNPVALGDEVNDLFIAGSATGFKAPDFPLRLQRIIEGLGISENTVALWVHGLLAERFAWSYLARQGVNQSYVRGLLESIASKSDQ
jgi:hypothetical protein